MIHLMGACRYGVKEFPKKKLFLRPTTVSVPTTDRTAILVGDANNIAPLLRIFGGQLRLNEGKILRENTLSPPIGRLANVSAKLTPYEAVQFASRLYDVDTSIMMASLMMLTEIEDFIDQPLQEIPVKFRNRFNHALWQVVRFSCYVYSQNIELSGDIEYNQRLEIFREKVLSDSGLLLFTSNLKTAENYCEHGLVYHDSTLIPFGNISEAVEFFKS